MSRGVFALTWFLLLATALINIYTTYDRLISTELSAQATLMDAEETFYLARNFEHEFRYAIANDRLNSFQDYWSVRGNLTHGTMHPFERRCIPSDQPFVKFVRSATRKTGSLVYLDPLHGQTCITLAIKNGKFKTYGVITSTLCVDPSSPSLSC